PDTYVVDRNPGTIKETLIGSKENKIVPGGGQGTKIERVSDAERRQPALSEEWVQKLVEEGEKIERHFESPQDIEWALADDRLWILQSRPITNLPPAPLKNVIWESATTGEKLIRRQVVEHMPGPLSPLFDDLYLSMGMDRSMDEFLESFGIHFDLGLMINRPFFKTVNGYAYSSASYKFNIKIVWMILQAYTKMLPKLLFRAVPRWRDEKLPAYLTTIEMWKTLDFSQEPDQQLWAGIQRLTTADAIYWFEVSIILGLAKVSDNLLHSFLTKQGKGLTSGLFLRGYPSKTLEAQLDLEQIADQIREDEAIKNLVLNTPAAEFLERLDELPSADGIVEAIDIFFDQYGHQIYSLDFVEPTQQEDAVPVLVGLKNLVENQSASAARQKKLAAERESLIESTARSFGPWKRWKFRRLVNFARKYAPYREDALFFIGAAWPTVRRIAHELGQRFVDRGIIQAPEDIYYLTAAEVEQALAGEGALLDFRRRARERFELREARKRLQPPPKIPDVPFKLGPIDMSIFETQKQNEREGNHLKGFAVSPGKITAPASVILTPADFEKMKPGTILVCPTTTPAWTPLFSQAAGLVTEIGGILAHGSIVAREYGIPAVMGLTDITQEIQDGQLITVDGDVGRVSLN
nr:PEP-utilizing enzyme [Ardenticatenaceae bacterium]